MVSLAMFWQFLTISCWNRKNCWAVSKISPILNPVTFLPKSYILFYAQDDFSKISLPKNFLGDEIWQNLGGARFFAIFSLFSLFGGFLKYGHFYLKLIYSSLRFNNFVWKVPKEPDPPSKNWLFLTKYEILDHLSSWQTPEKAEKCRFFIA